MTSMMTPGTVYHWLRTRFPNPTSPTDSSGRPGAYCVGGAFCQFMQPDARDDFPFPYYLADMLRKFNSSLTCKQSDNYGREIVTLNDAKQYERAWEVLREALEFTGAMKLYTVEFKARLKGSIGMCDVHIRDVRAETDSDALKSLYETYEHISDFKVVKCVSVNGPEPR